MADSDLQTFTPRFSYLQFHARNIGISWTQGGFFWIAAIIFFPLSFLIGSWIITVLCAGVLLLDYYDYYLSTKEIFNISNKEIQYIKYTLLNKKISESIPIKEIMNVELNKVPGPFTFYYKLSILLGLDMDEPMLFRKRTENIYFTNWDNDVALQIEDVLIKRLPRLTK